MSYEIAGEVFRTQECIKDRCRGIIAATPVGKRVSEADHAFMVGLLDRHPDVEGKRGCGLSHFEVRRGFGRQRGFWVVRTDGSSVDFSFYTCASGKGTTPRQDFAAAARHAVKPSLVAFREERFAGGEAAVSEMSGDVVTWDTSHVDHEEPTFREIVAAYLEEHPERLANPVTQGVGTEFVRRADADHFREFHDERARLRLVTVSENLRRKK